MTGRERRLLSFVCGFGRRESETGFFFALRSFLVGQLGARSFAVFSKAAERDGKDGWRLSWRDPGRGAGDDAGAWREVLDKLQDGTSLVARGPGDAEMRVLLLGRDASQKRYLAFSLDEPLGEDLAGHLALFVRTSWSNVLAFQAAGELRSLTWTDDVTGLYNQRRLRRDLDQAIGNARDYGVPFHVLFLDIDRFKDVNDRHGHLTGTRLLAHTARLLRAVLRENDLIYRYGGDEFVVIVPGVDFDGALAIGRRMLRAVGAHRFRGPGGGGRGTALRLSVSIGVAGFPGDARTRDDILDIADRMMYQAKAFGRGQVRSAKELLAGGEGEGVVPGAGFEPARPRGGNGF